MSKYHERLLFSNSVQLENSETIYKLKKKLFILEIIFESRI